MGGVPKGPPPPPNKKYANVKARLDTGCNELKIKSSETKANARFHRGENFKRLKVHSLARASPCRDHSQDVPAFHMLSHEQPSLCYFICRSAPWQHSCRIGQ